MANKTIIKNTRRQAAVKLIGTGPTTISIQELAYHDQTLDVPNVILGITDIAFCMGEAGNIVRDGNVIFTMPASSYEEFNFTQTIGVSLRENGNANIIVNFGNNVESTCIIQFSKEAGYVDPDRQILQPFER